MKAKERIRKIADSRWARTLALAVTAAIIFSWLYSHGISPVWTAVAIICFRGLFRFLYRIACFLVALAIILCILTEFSGLLKSDDMEHARNLSLQHKGAVRERAALFVSVTAGNDTERKGNGRKTQTLANRELQGKVGKRFLSDGKVRPQAVSEKIILAALRYFSRKPCLSGSICRWALVVQRAAKARVFTVKN